MCPPVTVFAPAAPTTSFSENLSRANRVKVNSVSDDELAVIPFIYETGFKT